MSNPPKDFKTVENRQLWRFSMDNEINWIEGTPGKGFIDDQYNVHTWTTEDGGGPNHLEYAASIGMDWDQVLVAFDIAPDGGIWAFLKDAVGPEARRVIQDADSRLNAADADDETWTFTGKTEDDILDWDEGHEGRGLIDRQGNVYTFDQEEFPYHADWLREHPDVMPKRYFWIEPDGQCRGSGMGDELDQIDEEVLREADPRLYVIQEEENTWKFDADPATL
jgi:hypothetical protein